MIKSINLDNNEYNIPAVIKKLSINDIVYEIGIDTSDANALNSDILLGKTAYVNGQKITGIIPLQETQTIVPGTSDKTIDSGRYLSGNQIIKGDANLKASNISKGVSIFGVTGTFSGSGDVLLFGSVQDGLDANKQFSFGDSFGHKWSNDNASLPLRITLSKNPTVAYVYNIEGPYDTASVVVGNKSASGIGLHELTNITGTSVTINTPNASVRKVICILG